MKPLLVLAILMPSLLGGCSTRAGTSRPEFAATFIVVRHAEKAGDGSTDPPLSPAGQARARLLADSLRERALRGAFATAYRRTRMTAEPAAALHGLDVTTYDAGQPAPEFAAHLRRTYPAGTVLVVGHSNTVAPIVAALCRCTVSPLGDEEYDRRFEIRIASDGTATLHQDRY